MMSNERGEHDYANQIKQANDHQRGAANGPYTIHSVIVLDRDGRWWQLCSDGECLQTTRNLDPQTPQHEGDALRGERNG